MPSRSLRKLFSTRSNHHRDASYVFCPYYLLMFRVMAFLVVVIDNVIVVTGIIVVSVIGSASAVIWPVSVVTAVTVIALIAVIFLRWPTPAIAGEKGNASRHQRRDEGDEDDFPHIYISHITRKCASPARFNLSNASQKRLRPGFRRIRHRLPTHLAMIAANDVIEFIRPYRAICRRHERVF